MKVRILVLGDDDVIVSKRNFESAGIELEIIHELRNQFWNEPLGRYFVSDRALQLAQAATPELYDAVVVGNNLGTGVDKACELPRSMQGRTMIVWNHFRSGDESAYADLGFTRFGNRLTLPSEGDAPDTEDFLMEIAERLKAAV